MPSLKKLRYRSACVVFLSALTIFTPVAPAQQDEIPPAPPTLSSSEDSNTPDAPRAERIIEARPRLYGVTRFLHPVSWTQAGARPVLRLIERAGFGNVASEEKAPRISGVKLRIQGLGSGSGFGPEVKPFHNNVFNKGMEVEIPLVVTYKLYERFGFRANYPLISGGPVDRLGIEVVGDYSSRPSDRFFGIGNDSSKGNESRFRSVTREAALALETRVNPHWTLRAESGFRSVGTTQPHAAPSATEVFGSLDLPGLTSSPGMTMATERIFVERNTKDNPHVPGSGGLQSVEASLNEGLSGGDFAYWRYRADLQQFFPLSEDRRKVLAFRARVETNQEKGGSQIPVFDLSAIGGRSTVRGFPGRRFVDKSALVASTEYRYRIWRHFDWAVFVDGGQVAPEIGDFAWKRFHTGYGMRFIARTESKHGVSLDVARSREGWGVYVDFSPTF